MTQSLPDAAEQVAAAEKESALVRIIDDEIDVREALALMLRIEGWTAKTYPNARAFLIEDDVRRPGCLVLDVRMPSDDGTRTPERNASSRSDAAHHLSDGACRY